MDQGLQPKPFQARLASVWLWLVRLGVVLVLIFTVAALSAHEHWRCEQLCHFRWQYAWLLLAGGVGLCLAKDYRFGIVAVSGAIANFVFVLPIYFPAAQPTVNGKSWKLISYNVLTRNNRHSDVSAWLRKEQADVVLLMEVDQRWAETIGQLSDCYPYQHLVPREDNFGIALLSRVPWEDVQTVAAGSTSLPTVVARFNDRDVRCTLIGTHPLPPTSAMAASHRNNQFTAVAKLVQKEMQSNVVVAGDFNITSYSPYFHELLQAADLRDSRQGRGLQASWSPRLPGLAIPIDHCLVTQQVEVVSRRVGPSLGSDHRPVVVELRTK